MQLQPLTKASCLFCPASRQLKLTRNLPEHANNFRTPAHQLVTLPSHCLQCALLRIYIFCWHSAFMSPKSCSNVFSTAGTLRFLPPRQSRPYQPRACFLLRLSFRVDPFLQWKNIERESVQQQYIQRVVVNCVFCLHLV